MLAIQAADRTEGLRLIDRMIDRLRIGSDAEPLAQNVRRANNPGALAIAVKELRAVSAEAGYHEIRNRLARRENFRIDLLAPRPLGSILRRLGLPEHVNDLQAELPGAIDTLKTILPKSEDISHSPGRPCLEAA
jgi:hypothetical protein